MSDINRMTMSGRVGSLDLNPGGNRLVIRLANNRYAGADKGDVAQWFSVVTFGKRAQALFDLLVEGSQVFIDGELRQEDYTDRDGVRKQRLEIVAESVVLGARPLGKREGS